MILKGKKTILRPIRFSDAQRFTDWLCDTEVNMFTSRRPTTLEGEKKWIKGLKEKKDELHFAIETKDGKHIGTISLEEISVRDQHASMGIFIGEKSYWNKGLGSDAIITIMNYGFKKLKLNRIELHMGVFEYNTRAIHAYEKIGFVREGAERERIFYDGKFHNVILMAVLAKEWGDKK